MQRLLIEYTLHCCVNQEIPTEFDRLKCVNALCVITLLTIRKRGKITRLASADNIDTSSGTKVCARKTAARPVQIIGMY